MLIDYYTSRSINVEILAVTTKYNKSSKFVKDLKTRLVENRFKFAGNYFGLLFKS